MFKASQILVRVLALAAAAATLAACGQTGDLYLPQEPAARERASLPQTLTPQLPTRSADAPSAPPTSSTAPRTAP